MIRHLASLEKRRDTWLLIGISIVFMFLRLPSLIEPYWYGDEGIYQALGIAIRNGSQLYSQIWDNKPPLLYLLYAFFNGDQFLVRFFSLITGIASVWLFFFLAKLCTQSEKGSIIGTVVFALLFATPYAEGTIANAENFIIPLTLIGAIITWKITQAHISFSQLKWHEYFYKDTAGKNIAAMSIILGIGFMTKVVALFDYLAFIIFLLYFILPSFSFREKFHISKTMIKKSFQLVAISMSSFIFPLLFFIVFFLFQGTLKDFISSVFMTNINYVDYSNSQAFLKGFLLIKSAIVFVSIVLLYLYKNKLSQSTLFVLLWSIFSLYSIFFSQRPYTHYVLLGISAFSLLVSLFISTIKERIVLGISILLFSGLILRTFSFYYMPHPFTYYTNYLQFISGQKSVLNYYSFFGGHVERDYKVAAYINSHTKESDTIFIWGNSAQLYKMTNKIPLVKYTVAYHIQGNKEAIAEAVQAIETKKPKYIIVLSNENTLPFPISTYRSTVSIDRSTIYERTN